MAKIVVQPGQSLLDVAVKYYGSVEGVFDVVRRNKLNGITDNIYAGDELEVAEAPLNPRVARFLSSHQMATMEERLRPEGIGWMQVTKSSSLRASARDFFCVAETPRVTLRAEQSYVDEGTSVRIYVELNHPAETRVSIPVRVIEAGGASVADYTIKDAGGASIAIADGHFTFVFEAGQTAQPFSVEATQDVLAETGEGLILALVDLPQDYRVGAQQIVALPFTGSEDKELIPIDTLEQLNAIRWDLNGDGIPETAHRTEYEAAFPHLFDRVRQYGGYRLTQDLDFAGTEWENPQNGTFTGTHIVGGWPPIGGSAVKFTATFDGNGHVIRNLYINRPTQDYAGLFGWGSFPGEFHNLGFEGGSIVASSQVGVLMGTVTTGVITQCYANLLVITAGSNVVGGLVGTVTNSSVNSCNVNVDVSGTSNVAGFAGVVSGASTLISKCRFSGNVSSTGFAGRTGGFMGFGSNAVIEDCYATGDVVAADSIARIGGFVGQQAGGVISRCYSLGNVTGSSNFIGGFVGQNAGTINNSHFDSDASNRPASDDFAQTTEDLQMPTSATGIYATWDEDIWDFGTSTQYPVLKLDFNGDGDIADDITRQRQ